MTGGVAVLGENLVDLVVDERGAITPLLGGGPFTVARTMARLGLRPQFYSGIAGDQFGRAVRDALIADGVDIVFDRPSSKPTSIALVETSDGAATYTFYLDGTAAFDVDPARVLGRYGEAPTPSALYVGTLGLVVEPMASAARALVASASPDTLVIADPNCRPGAIREPERYRVVLGELFGRADVVKVSTDDLRFIDPGRDPLDAARAIVAAGVPWVIVTDGPRPVHLVGSASRTTLGVDDRPIVDAIGAGDALVGAFVAWWVGQGLTRGSLADADAVRGAVSAAIEVAGVTCERRGALPPRMGDLAHSVAWQWLVVAPRSEPSA